jgi:aspartate aminotransferase-like enzyme
MSPQPPRTQGAARGKRGGRLTFKIASTAAEFEAIHRLNHATFAVEIPQHAANRHRRLIDPYHRENTYVICLCGEMVVGMVAGRCSRPFSLDRKIANLDAHLPAHRKAVEIRLLAVAPRYRYSTVFVGLVSRIARYFVDEQCDLALISGTVRQLRLYQQMGFRPFASPVGTAEALYQPMFLTLQALQQTPLLHSGDARARTVANFLPGPVAMRADVLAAFAAKSVSHRDACFIEQLDRVRKRLTELVCAPHVVLLVGTGTLGNDAVAAQLRCIGGQGLIVSNGEFGERLADHARRWDLPFSAVHFEWGRAYDWPRLQAIVERSRPKWVWAVLCETSTGIHNAKERLRALCASVGADLCLDAVSAVGLFPVNLEGVRFATAVSGKGLAAPAGLVGVFYDGRIAPPGRAPRYLDLAYYESNSGVPFTHSSNLVASLDCSLTATSWPEKFERVARASCALRADLRTRGLQLVAAEADAAPGIVTIALPSGADSQAVAIAMQAAGIHIAWMSAYLRQRNWVQICLMGEFDAAALRRAPRLLAQAIAGCRVQYATTSAAGPQRTLASIAPRTWSGRVSALDGRQPFAAGETIKPA